MRLLHTADWHLGRSFHGESLLAAHAAVVDHAVAVAREARVDAVVIAGDLYDRAIPPVDAVRLADEALARLSEVAPVVVISGNHDSVDRLGFGAQVLERAGVHVRTRPEDCGTPVVVGEGVVYPLPYLEPDVVRAQLDAPERSHAGVLGAAMDRVRADLGRRAPGTPSAVVAHAFVTGAVESPGSERDLAVGGSATAPISTFDGVDAVLLGHLHAPQRAGTTGRYAGSPVALSFAEARHEKSLVVTEVMPLGTTHELVACPVPRPLAALRGTLAELLSDPAHAGVEQAWVHATVTDPVRPDEAMARVRRRFPHAVALAFEPEGASPEAGGSYAARLEGLDDRALLARFVSDVRGTEATPEEEDLLDRALGAGRAAEVRV